MYVDGERVTLDPETGITHVIDKPLELTILKLPVISSILIWAVEEKWVMQQAVAWVIKLFSSAK